MSPELIVFSLTITFIWISHTTEAIYLPCGHCICEDTTFKAVCQSRRLTHLSGIPLEIRKSLLYVQAANNMITELHEDDITGYEGEKVVINVEQQTRTSCVQLSTSLRKVFEIKYSNIEIKGLCDTVDTEMTSTTRKKKKRPSTTISPIHSPTVIFFPVPIPIDVPHDNVADDEDDDDDENEESTTEYPTPTVVNEEDEEYEEDEEEEDEEEDEEEENFENGLDFDDDFTGVEQDFTLVASILFIVVIVVLIIYFFLKCVCQRKRNKQDGIELINIKSNTANPIQTENRGAPFSYVIPFTTETLQAASASMRSDMSDMSDETLYENVHLERARLGKGKSGGKKVVKSRVKKEK